MASHRHSCRNIKKNVLPKGSLEHPIANYIKKYIATFYRFMSLFELYTFYINKCTCIIKYVFSFILGSESHVNDLVFFLCKIDRILTTLQKSSLSNTLILRVQQSNRLAHTACIHERRSKDTVIILKTGYQYSVYAFPFVN